MPKTPPYLVSIILYGDQLDPDKISQSFSCFPTKGWRKGEQKYPHRKYIAKTGLWKLTAQSTSEKLDEHIQELVRKLSLREKENITNISGVDICVFDIFAIESYRSDPKDVCFSINAENTRAIGQLGVDITFTVGRVSSPD